MYVADDKRMGATAPAAASLRLRFNYVYFAWVPFWLSGQQ